MEIKITASLGKEVASGWVRSKIEANRLTGEWIKITGCSCTWKRVWQPFEIPKN